MSSFFSDRLMMMGDDLGALAHTDPASAIVGRATSSGDAMTAAEWRFLSEPVLHDPFHDLLLSETPAATSTFMINPTDPMVGLSKTTLNGNSDAKLHGEKMKAHGGPVVDHSGAMQMSFPRAPKIKTRKIQPKKVVCIPAPAASSNKTCGEVVPSDLWAWRKYGQKPIKGSPYPRGYYRCSSSKGCSARKQVERSLTDPTMLVVTYTSDHNHPLPTQRNALAGSTRSSQALKKTPSSSKESLRSNLDEEVKGVTTSLSTTTPSVMDVKPMLGELEGDPIDDLDFTKGFLGYMKSIEERENKASSLDPFTFFDWGGYPFEEAMGGL